MNLQERIAAMLEFSGMSIPRFAKYIGCPTQFTIRDLLSGKTKSLSFAVKTKILAAFPDINEAWLETGEGLMTNSQSTRSGLTDCQRVEAILSHYKLSVKELSLLLGLKNPQIIYNIKNNRCGISDRFSEAIMGKFPEINPQWLLTGEGDMLRGNGAGDTVVPLGRVVPAIQERLAQVRFFDLRPTASFREFCATGTEEVESMDVLPDAHELLSDANCAFQIHGDSMEPQIHSKAKVLCEEIKPTKWHMVDGVIVIAYADRFVIKRVIKNRLATENYILLGSDNPDYPEQEYAQLCDIRCIFRAVRILSQVIS